jgi:hypothetical protein
LWKKFAALSLKYIDLFDYFNFMKLEFIFSPYDTNDEDIGSLAQSDAEWKLLQFYHYLISKPVFFLPQSNAPGRGQFSSFSKDMNNHGFNDYLHPWTAN